jgi:hypothetical protein
MGGNEDLRDSRRLLVRQCRRNREGFTFGGDYVLRVSTPAHQTHDPVAWPPSRYCSARRLHLACVLETRYAPRPARRRRVPPAALQQVCAVHPGGVDPHAYLVPARLRDRFRSKPQDFRRARLADHDRPHLSHRLPPISRCATGVELASRCAKLGADRVRRVIPAAWSFGITPFKPAPQRRRTTATTVTRPGNARTGNGDLLRGDSGTHRPGLVRLWTRPPGERGPSKHGWQRLRVGWPTGATIPITTPMSTSTTNKSTMEKPRPHRTDLTLSSLTIIFGGCFFSGTTAVKPPSPCHS